MAFKMYNYTFKIIIFIRLLMHTCGQLPITSYFAKMSKHT